MNFVEALHQVKINAFFSQGKATQWALEKSVGDAHLLKNNPIFLDVRKKVVNLGFGFSSENQDAYSTMPIASLNRILKSRQIPFSPNAVALQELLKESKYLFHFSEIPEMKSNYTLHEGAHVLAHKEARFLHLDYLEQASEKNIRAMLLQESFANASEQQGNAFLQSKEDYVAYFFNSWIHASPKEIQKQKQGLDLLGENLSFRVLLLGFVFSNFLYSSLKQKETAWALDFLLQGRKCSEKEKNHILFFMRLGFKLSENFRVQTSAFQLQYLGVKKSIFDITQAGVPALFEDHKTGLTDLFERLVAIYYK